MSTEVKKTVHGWFLGFASLLLAIALGVLFSAASDLTDASMQFNALTVKQPRFADFVGPQRYDMLMKKATKRPAANPAHIYRGCRSRELALEVTERGPRKSH